MIVLVKPKPGPVQLDGVNRTIRIERVAGGRLVVETPYHRDLAPAMRSMRAKRARLLPAGTGPEGRPVLTDLRVLAETRKEHSHSATGAFAWTVAAHRDADLTVLLQRLFPDLAVVTGALPLFAALTHTVQVTAASDGRLRVVAPCLRDWSPRSLGGVWDKTNRCWLVAYTQADNLASSLTREYGTHAEEIAAAANAAVQKASESIAREAARIREELTDSGAPNDGLTPPLPFIYGGVRYTRNRRSGWCDCGTKVPVGTGDWGWCDDSHSTRDGGFCTGGECGGNLRCGDCLWRQAYTIPVDWRHKETFPDPQPWVRLGMSIVRTRLCVAAGLTATDSDCLTATHEDLALLAALVSTEG